MMKMCNDEDESSSQCLKGFRHWEKTLTLAAILET